MKTSIMHKLEHMVARHEEVSALLSEPDVIAAQDRFRTLSKEYAQLEPVSVTFNAYQKCLRSITSAEEMRKEKDLELRALAEDELQQAQQQLTQIEHALLVLLLPKDPYDDSNIFLEIRAGTGGNEAAIFAGNLFRMYARYAEQENWKIEILSENPGEHGGYKEIIARIIGQGAYSKLKFESGAHRVQRVPETESQGRIHTSAATVAVLPEVDDVEEVDINMNEVRIDTYRASGAGGQHVNKTDSAVRLTHLPTGIVVECQDERSQHKNRSRALSLLKARILDIEREKQRSEQAKTRKSLVGSGDRSERIRTYNFPQGRVTDHRINLTLYKLDEIIQGDLNPVIEPLRSEHQADRLALLTTESR